MPIDDIDWGKLKPYAADRRHSFEELCYQLVYHQERSRGKLTRLDGSGGDGGVEFYLTLPDGDEWGWQAKFFYPDKRLDSGRKEQIKGSLSQAVRKHPRLVRWTLVCPEELTKAEDEWLRRDLPGMIHKGEPVVPPGRNIELDSLGDSRLHTMLANPAAAGIRSYFFGGVELNLQWFQQRYRAAVEALNKKFLPGLHSDTSADVAIGRIVANPALLDELVAIQGSLSAHRKKISDLEKVRSRFPAFPEKLRDAHEALLAAYRRAAEHFATSERQLGFAVDALKDGRWRDARDTSIPDPRALEADTDEASRSAREWVFRPIWALVPAGSGQ